MAGNSADPGRSVTSKVVSILFTFADSNVQTLTEIARLTGLSAKADACRVAVR